MRAWTGIRMGARLSRALGPAATWRVMQVLGELNVPRAPQESTAEAGITGMSRRQFVKGVGGAAVAMSLMFGTGVFAPAAVARSGSVGGLEFVRRTDVRGKRLIDVARKVAQRSDMANITGRDWAVRAGDGRFVESGGHVVLVDDTESSTRTSDRTIGATARVEVKAARHTLTGGNSLLAVGFKLPDNDRFVLYYEFDRPVADGTGELKTRAALHAVAGEDLVLENLSVNGGLVSLQESDRLSATRASCGRCYTTYRYTSRACVRQKWGCLLVACAACIPACATIIGCAYCAGVQCPYAYLYACCKERGYVCPPCRG